MKLSMEKPRKVVGAVAQLAQAFFDTRTNLANACKAIREAGKQGADIVVFSECFLGQYPYWAQYYNASAEGFMKTFTALYDTAIQVGGPECKELSRAAREAGVYVVMGCNELSDRPGSSTLYNTLLFFDRNGELMGRHRKLMPTYHERLIHGWGDGRDLKVYKTDIGNLGGLICWEHHMTLSKYAMATMGEEIHVATWPGLWRGGDVNNNERAMEPDLGPIFTCDEEHAIREYATETGNFVLSGSGYLPAENIPNEWKEAIPSLQADWAIGGSAIVAPGGQFLVRPVINKEEILYAELDFNVRRMWKAFFDPIGHYSRPDVYSLNLNALKGREYSYTAEKSNSSDPFNNGNSIDQPIDIKIRKIAEKYGLDISEAKELFRELNKF
jgi:nitrilase